MAMALVYGNIGRGGFDVSSIIMTPDQVELLRRLALNEAETVKSVMSGDLSEAMESLDPRTAALVRIAALLSVDSDPSAFRWAVDIGVAAGLEDSEIIHALILVAPIVGTGRITSAIPALLAALDVDFLDD